MTGGGDDTLGVRALTTAATSAPDAPGVYFFLDETAELLYVGKAGSLRKRFRQHAQMGPATSWLHERYGLVREVRWQQLPDEEAAAWREADLIFALRPPFNAEAFVRWPGLGDGERAPAFIVVGEGSRGVRFSLVTEPRVGRGRAYGCFPHLGKGLGSRPGVVCSDGYVAFLRVLWAASGGDDRVPAAITKSAPPAFEVGVDERYRRGLHALLSGVSAKVIDELFVVASTRPAYMQPALRRDRESAHGFFVAGPRALRSLRLRHALPPGPVAGETWRELVRAEVTEAVGL